jgi:hypothetical protein
VSREPRQLPKLTFSPAQRSSEVGVGMALASKSVPTTSTPPASSNGPSSCAAAADDEEDEVPRRSYCEVLRSGSPPVEPSPGVEASSVAQKGVASLLSYTI